MNLKEPKTQKILIGVRGTRRRPDTSTSARRSCRSTTRCARRRSQQLAAEHEKLAAEVEKARKVVGDLARLEAEYERLHDQWLSAQELLPEEKEMPDLLRQVTTAGSRSGVEFALFEPDAPVAHEFYTGSSDHGDGARQLPPGGIVHRTSLEPGAHRERQRTGDGAAQAKARAARRRPVTSKKKTDRSPTKNTVARSTTRWKPRSRSPPTRCSDGVSQ